jgi:predicted RNase H-like nuclease (RuvC/YqgF family)
MENETQKTPETQQTQATQATLEAALAEKDARIAELQAELSEAKQAAESLRAEGVAISEARDQAISKYLEAARALNPAIPGDIIAGESIEEIDASVEKARTIADAVRQNLEAQAREARVPAGAPARGEISLEGLTPREKIAAGIQQKGGTQS